MPRKGRGHGHAIGHFAWPIISGPKRSWPPAKAQADGSVRQAAVRSRGAMGVQVGSIGIHAGITRADVVARGGREPAAPILRYQAAGPECRAGQGWRWRAAGAGGSRGFRHDTRGKPAGEFSPAAGARAAIAAQWGNWPPGSEPGAGPSPLGITQAQAAPLPRTGTRPPALGNTAACHRRQWRLLPGSLQPAKWPGHSTPGRSGLTPAGIPRLSCAYDFPDLGRSHSDVGSSPPSDTQIGVISPKSDTA